MLTLGRPLFNTISGAYILCAQETGPRGKRGPPAEEM